MILDKNGEPIKEQKVKPNWPIRFDATPDVRLTGSSTPGGTPTDKAKKYYWDYSDRTRDVVIKQTKENENGRY